MELGNSVRVSLNNSVYTLIYKIVNDSVFGSVTVPIYRAIVILNLIPIDNSVGKHDNIIFKSFFRRLRPIIKY